MVYNKGFIFYKIDYYLSLMIGSCIINNVIIKKGKLAVKGNKWLKFLFVYTNLSKCDRASQPTKSKTIQIYEKQCPHISSFDDVFNNFYI